MKTKEFSFNLPEELIAQHPPQERGNSRLLVLNRKSGTMIHSSVAQLPSFLDENTLMVFNNSKVRKARLFAQPVSSPGRVEFLLLNRKEPSLWKALCNRSKKQRPGKTYLFPGYIKGTIQDIEGIYRIIRFSQEITEEYLETYGHVPLPPYIKREDLSEDSLRYQTIFAKEPGSSAAPTAGLHFTETLLAELKDRGVQQEWLTLHVGLGTFLPLRAVDIEDHVMHEESYSISQDTAQRITEGKRRGKKICAVGTTVVRTLESAWELGEIKSGEGSTALYIKPGYDFKVVDALFTNFHTPESTLLVLVSTFAGFDLIKRAYTEAVREKYRFFSYGDAMLIL